MFTRKHSRFVATASFVLVLIGSVLASPIAADAPATASSPTTPSSRTATREAEIKAWLDEADVIFMRGELPVALEKLSHAFRVAANEFGPLAEITLWAHNDYAGTLYHMGRLQEAKAEFELVLARFKAGLGEEHLIAIDALNNYANVTYELSSAREALALSRKALEMRQRVQREDHLDAISALGDYGLSLGSTGELHEALAIAERTLALRQKHQGDKHPWTFTAMNNVGHALNALGRYDAAVAIHETALRLRLAERGPRHAETLSTQQNLAVALAALGRNAEARRLRESTLKVQLEVLGPQHQETLATRQGIATDLLAQNRLDEAEVVARAVLRDRLLVQSQDHTAVIATRLLLTDIFERQNLLDAARDQIDRTLAVLAAGERADHFVTLNARHIQARLQRKSGDAQGALAQQAAVFVQASERYGASFPVTLQSGIEQARCLYVLKRLPEASERLGEALRVIESLRDALPSSDDIAQRRLLQQYDEAYKLQVAIVSQLGDVNQAFALLERLKARTLAEGMADANAATRAGVPPEDWQSLQAAKERVRGLNLLLRTINRVNDRAPVVALLQTALEAAQTQHSVLSVKHPKFAALSALHRTQLPSPSELPPHTTYLSYAVTVDAQVEAMTLSTRHGLRWTPLGRIVGLTDSIDALRLWTANRGQRRPTDDLGRIVDIVHWVEQGQPRWRVVVGDAVCATAWTQDEAPCRPDVAKTVWGNAHAFDALRDFLSARLLAPLGETLATSPRWLISPDRALGVLPWDVLTLRGRTVAATHAVSQVQSLVVWASSRRTPLSMAVDADSLALFAIGNPAFPEAAGALRRAPLRRAVAPVWRQATFAAPSRSFGVGNGSEHEREREPHRWPRLPSSQFEMQQSAQHFGKNQSRIVSGAEATKANVLRASTSGELAKAKHILFATHAYYDPAAPHRSAIILRPEGTGNDDTGELTLSEISGLRLNARLTVLSACNTARGEAVSADGLFGFAYALSLAGSQDALLTLWPVNDRATADFVSQFFGRVALGQSHVTALHQTKQAFQNHPNRSYRAPKNWAGFVLYGG